MAQLFVSSSSPFAFRFTPYTFRRGLGLCIALLTLGVTRATAEDHPVVRNVQCISTADSVRVIVSLSAPAAYQIVTDPSDPQKAPLSRLHISFSPAELSPEVRATLKVEGSVLKEVHTGQVSATTVRVSLEVQQLGTYRTIALRYPDQVVIYLAKGTTERQVSLPSSPPPPSEPQGNLPSSHRYRIMLDPGHGGSDPGAEGIAGLEEKTAVLAISKRLAKKLQERLAVDVLFTRTQDVFIPLEGRTARANAAKADLFISIHANAGTNPDSQGIETYYLNNTDDRATIRLAKLENGLREKLRLQQRGAELAFILSDLIQTGKEDASIALAHALQKSLVSRARTHYPQVHNLGVKKGPFYVLVGAHMPCVLVETAFLTHPIEGKYLGATAYQEALAEGLFQGIASFLRTELMAKNL